LYASGENRYTHTMRILKCRLVTVVKGMHKNGTQMTPEYRDGNKPAYVKAMFDAIAGNYDRINSLLSFKRDRSWRRFTASRAAMPHDGIALDVATGTGELAKCIAGKRSDNRVIGVDFSPNMLELARCKIDASGFGDQIQLVLGDVLYLPFPNSTFDFVTIGFGLRNVSDISATFCELVRVVKPGCKVVSLELTQPSSGLVRALHNFGLSHILPHIGGCVSGNREAYTYLPDSIKGFISNDEVIEIMQEAGLHDVKTYRLTMGVATVHEGCKSG